MKAKNYLTNGQGVRISRTGKRYMVSDSTVWNLLNEENNYCGQAATFSQGMLIESA